MQVLMCVIHALRGRAFEHIDLVVFGQDGNGLGLVHVVFILELRGAPENKVADRELSTPHRGFSRSGDGASKHTHFSVRRVRAPLSVRRRFPVRRRHPLVHEILVGT